MAMSTREGLELDGTKSRYGITLDVTPPQRERSRTGVSSTARN